MSWDSYVAMMLNTLDPETQQYIETGVGTHGAIYGKDGSKWGTSEGYELYAYDYSIDMGDGTTETEYINEVEIVKGIFEGKTKGGKAGVRIGNTKFMYINNYDGVHKLSCKGGGALLAETGKCYLIATWDQGNLTSGGKPQNPGDLEKNVKYLREYLVEYEKTSG